MGTVIGCFYTSFEKPLKMRRCKSYIFIKLMLFLWPSLKPDHIGMVGISKWRLLVVEPETPLSPFCFDKGNWPRMLLLVLFLKPILNSLWFGILNLAFGLTNVNERGLWAMQRGADGELTIGIRSLLWFYGFNTIIGVSEPIYGNVCLSLCMLVFKKKNTFD